MTAGRPADTHGKLSPVSTPALGDYSEAGTHRRAHADSVFARFGGAVSAAEKPVKRAHR